MAPLHLHLQVLQLFPGAAWLLQNYCNYLLSQILAIPIVCWVREKSAATPDTSGRSRPISAYFASESSLALGKWQNCESNRKKKSDPDSTYLTSGPSVCWSDLNNRRKQEWSENEKNNWDPSLCHYVAYDKSDDQEMRRNSCLTFGTVVNSALLVEDPGFHCLVNHWVQIYWDYLWDCIIHPRMGESYSISINLKRVSADARGGQLLSFPAPTMFEISLKLSKICENREKQKSCWHTLSVILGKSINY